MTLNPVKLIARRKALRECASKVPTGLVPLSGIKTATVYIERNSYDWSATERKVRKFFENKNIQVETVILNSLDVDWLGRSRRSETKKTIEGHEDLLISLLPVNTFALKYCAVSSNAKFKIGREQIRKNVFDLVVSDRTSDNEDGSQIAVFDYITELFTKLQ